MKLRNSIFLFFGALILSLVFVQLWIINNLDKEIRKEMSNTAYLVSKNANDKIIEENKLNPTENSLPKEISESPTTFVKIGAENGYKIESIGPTKEKFVDVSQLRIEESINDYFSNITYSMMVILVAGLFITGFFSIKVSRPLQELTELADLISQGKFGETLHPKHNSVIVEVNTLISRFNMMSEELEILEKRNRKLQQKRQLNDMGDIAKGIAHSLRNPLNTLSLGIDELVSSNPDEQRREKISKIVNNQLERIDQWVKNFLMLSHVSATALKPVNISHLIEDLKLEFKFTKPEIKWHLNLQTDCSIEGIEEELRAILQILIENALEVSDEKGNIYIASEQQQNQCKIFIEDEGLGISEEVKRKLFTPGFSIKEKGFGMGLYIAKSLASGRYDGNITLENRTGDEDVVGTIATLTLENKPTESLIIES